MCKYFNKCERFCKSQKSHFRHWEHVRKYAEKKDTAFLQYRTYKRIHKDIIDENIDIMDKNNKKERNSSSLINYDKYERYILENMIEKIIYDIINKL